MGKERISTSKLLSKIFKTSSITRFVESYDDDMIRIPFYAYLNHLCADKGIVAAHGIRKSGIERTYGHQLFNGTHRPSRNRVIRMTLSSKHPVTSDVAVSNCNTACILDKSTRGI